MSKGGKYAKVIGNLQKTWGTEPAYQDKVNERKDQILKSGRTVEATVPDLLTQVETAWGVLNDALIEAADGKQWGANLAKAYAVAREAKNKLAEREYDLNMTLAALEQLIISQYEVESVSSLTMGDGASVRTQPEPQAQVKDRDAFREWCMKNGYERSLMLPWQTTNSLTKEMLLKGQGQPDGVEVKVLTKVFYSKG